MTASTGSTGADDYAILIGDTWWSPQTWAIIINGEGIDLTDPAWSVNAQIRRRPDSEVLHDFTGDGIVIGSATFDVNGSPVVASTVRLYIPAETTATFNEWWGVWDVQLTHPTRGRDGVLWRRTFRSGKVRTIRDVTR